MNSKTRQVNWERLIKRYSIEIQTSRATVSKRGWSLGDKRVFSATAILGTKVAEVKMNSSNGMPGPVFDVDNAKTFTESNLATELRQICLFILAEYDAAQESARAGE
jgi:hypothetical protein